MDKKLIPIPSRGMLTERDIDKPPILDIHGLGIDFGGLHAVENFTLVMGRTEIAGLIGPNGAGKTTVFNLITNVYQPTRHPAGLPSDTVLVFPCQVVSGSFGMIYMTIERQ